MVKFNKVFGVKIVSVVAVIIFLVTATVYPNSTTPPNSNLRKELDFNDPDATSRYLCVLIAALWHKTILLDGRSPEEAFLRAENIVTNNPNVGERGIEITRDGEGNLWISHEQNKTYIVAYKTGEFGPKSKEEFIASTGKVGEEALLSFEELMGLVSFEAADPFLGAVERSLVHDIITPGQAMVVCLNVLSRNPGDPLLIGEILEYFTELKVRYSFTKEQRDYYREYQRVIAEKPISSIINNVGNYSAFDLLLFELYLGSRNELPVEIADTTYYEVLFNIFLNLTAPSFVSAIAEWSDENYFYGDLPPALKQALEAWAFRYRIHDAFDSRESLGQLIEKIAEPKNLLEFQEILQERAFYTSTKRGRYNTELVRLRDALDIPKGSSHLDIGCAGLETTRDAQLIFSTRESIGVDVLSLEEIEQRAKEAIIEERMGTFSYESSRDASENAQLLHTSPVEFRQLDITHQLPDEFVGRFNLTTALNSIVPNITQRRRAAAFASMYRSLLSYNESQELNTLPSIMVIHGYHFITNSAFNMNVFQANSRGGLDLIFGEVYSFKAPISTTPIIGKESVQSYLLSLYDIRGSEMMPSKLVGVFASLDQVKKHRTQK